MGPKGGRGHQQNPKSYSKLNLGKVGKKGKGLKIHVIKSYLIFPFFMYRILRHKSHITQSTFPKFVILNIFEY